MDNSFFGDVISAETSGNSLIQTFFHSFFYWLEHKRVWISVQETILPAVVFQSSEATGQPPTPSMSFMRGWESRCSIRPAHNRQSATKKKLIHEVKHFNNFQIFTKSKMEKCINYVYVTGTYNWMHIYQIGIRCVKDFVGLWLKFQIKK